MSNMLPADLARNMYRDMFRIRQFENKVIALVDDNEIPGSCHEYIGEEAIAVGVCSALTPRDILTSTHRGHGHLLAKGGDVGRMFAELFARETGYNRGRGGSMHIADFNIGIYGANGIVGAGTPIACGAAHKFKMRSEPNVAVSFFGDGGINQGVVHEAMNLAAIWRLPVVFVCENNHYAISTPLRDVSLVEPHVRAKAYGMPSVLVDGMDVRAVFDAAVTAVDRARAGDGPTFLECNTYRFQGHYSGERHMKVTYRSKDELEAWKKRDPIELWGAHLIASGVCTAEQLASMQSEINEEITQGIEFARKSAAPEVSGALSHMYAVNYPNTPAKGIEQ